MLHSTMTPRHYRRILALALPFATAALLSACAPAPEENEKTPLGAPGSRNCVDPESACLTPVGCFPNGAPDNADCGDASA